MNSWIAERAIRNEYQGLVNLLQQEIMLYPTVESAVDAFAAMARYSEYLRKSGK